MQLICLHRPGLQTWNDPHSLVQGSSARAQDAPTTSERVPETLVSQPSIIGSSRGTWTILGYSLNLLPRTLTTTHI
ncbi:hypothetical protein HAX54_042040, partial [Datura stramonium]|nr:hypothetical protein [Datura stramonium]